MTRILQISILSLFVFCSVAHSDPINIVSYASLTGTLVVTFDDLPPAGMPGFNVDSIGASQGVLFGERFAGQTLSFNGDFDVLSGTPTGSLTLLGGGNGQNVNVLTDPPEPLEQQGSRHSLAANSAPSNIVAGLGHNGFPNFSAVGEGSLAFWFSNDQSQFGFELIGGNGGDAFVSFFRRDGSLIQMIDVPNLTNDFYGFTREGGQQDIAGVAVYNNDLGGIGLDNLKHDVSSNATVPVPEPAALLLLGNGLLLGFGILERFPRKAP